MKVLKLRQALCLSQVSSCRHLFQRLIQEPTPLLTGNSPKGAFAIGEGGDIEVTFLNRGLDLVDVSVTVNGAEVASKVTVDGKVSSILHHLETLRVQLKLQSLTMEKRSNGPI